MTDQYRFYEMAARPLVSESSEFEGSIQRMTDVSTSFHSEGDAEAGVTFRGPGLDSEGSSSGARYRGQSDTASPSRDNEDFINIQGVDAVAQALEKCEKYVLRPYRFVLKVLGWTNFTRDGDSWPLKILRGCIVAFWVLVITAAVVTQILSCFRRDMIPSRSLASSNQTVIECEKGLISSYILTDILLYASYFFGLYLFSRGETEYLSNLADKVCQQYTKYVPMGNMTAGCRWGIITVIVFMGSLYLWGFSIQEVFIQTAKAKEGIKSTRWIIGTIGFFFATGIAWIVASFVVRLLTSFAFEVWHPTTIIQWNSSNFTIEGSEKIGLVVFSLIGFIFFDIVYVAAVMNYAAQSELNIYLLRAIRQLVETKQYPDMDTAIKDILECRKYLHVLNGKTATATALILFNLGSAALVAIVTLNGLSKYEFLVDVAFSTVCSGLNTILWLLLVSFPFIQAARVTNACDKLKQTGPEIRARPLQYVNTPQIDLDSYIHLTQSVRMRASMFGVPVYPWMTYAALVIFTFTALVLFQLGTYSFTRWL